MRRPRPLSFDVAALRQTETETAPGGRILNAATSLGITDQIDR
jgi:hypothetical protein